jgi:hypothetical protein
VPTWYLDWLRTVAQRPRLKDAIEEELAARRAERDTGTPRPLAELSPDCRRVAQAIVRKGYRLLASELHPDHGGSTEGMRDLNAAHAVLKRLVGESAG